MPADQTTLASSDRLFSSSSSSFLFCSSIALFVSSAALLFFSSWTLWDLKCNVSDRMSLFQLKSFYFQQSLKPFHWEELFEKFFLYFPLLLNSLRSLSGGALWRLRGGGRFRFLLRIICISAKIQNITREKNGDDGNQNWSIKIIAFSCVGISSEGRMFSWSLSIDFILCEY